MPSPSIALDRPRWQVRFLAESIFVPGSGVRQGTFIEDTYGKQTQMAEWLASAAFAAKRASDVGCFLLSDATAEPMMRHLDGKTYLDPEQRARAGLRAYPTDWTAALQADGEATVGDGEAALTPVYATGATQPRPAEANKATNKDSAQDVAEAAAEAVAEAVAEGGRELPPPAAQPRRRADEAIEETIDEAACEVALVPLRDALCWDALAGGCTSLPSCTKLHPTHGGVAVCGRHLTTALGLWGRRRRPPCSGACRKAHPTVAELECALARCLPSGSRLHAHSNAPARFGPSGATAGDHAAADAAAGALTAVLAPSRDLYVASSDTSVADADAALEARGPVALRVAIDVGFDQMMSDAERISLATQCGLCHGLASQAEHRPHVALAICCGTSGGTSGGSPGDGGGRDPGNHPRAGSPGDRPCARAEGGGGESSVVRQPVASSADRSKATHGTQSSMDRLRAAGIGCWRPLAWQSESGDPLSVLSMPGVASGELIYLCPTADAVLSCLSPSDVYVLAGLVERHKQEPAAALGQRAAALGIRCAHLPLREHLPRPSTDLPRPSVGLPRPSSRCARLPLREHLPAELPASAAEGLNLHSTFRLLLEWSRTRDWARAIAAAALHTRHLCPSTGMIHANGYWDGPQIASQHQFDGALSDALLAFFRTEGARTVADLGCGMGSYVRHFLEHGLSAIGFDGNPATPKLSNGTCAVLDLSVVANVDEPFDWVLSLEVGEHLPPEHEATFLENLHRHSARGIVLSWAVKGQGGTGHVNEQDNDYVKAKLDAKGYINDVPAEQALRAAAKFSYFRRGVMVFRRPR